MKDLKNEIEDFYENIKEGNKEEAQKACDKMGGVRMGDMQRKCCHVKDVIDCKKMRDFFEDTDGGAMAYNACKAGNGMANDKCCKIGDIKVCKAPNDAEEWRQFKKEIKDFYDKIKEGKTNEAKKYCEKMNGKHGMEGMVKGKCCEVKGIVDCKKMKNFFEDIKDGANPQAFEACKAGNGMANNNCCDMAGIKVCKEANSTSPWKDFKNEIRNDFNQRKVPR